MTRILVLTTQFGSKSGGIGRYVEELTFASVQELGALVTVVLPRKHRATPSHPNLSFRTFEGPPVETGRPWALRSMAKIVEECLRQERFDVIHAADLPSVLAVRYLRSRRVPLPHSQATVCGTDLLFLTNRAPKWLRSALFDNFDRVLAISAFTSGMFRTTVPGFSPSRLRVTPLGVGPAFFLAESSAEEKHDFGVLAVGRLDPRKGHHITLQAIEELDASDVHLDVVAPWVDDAYARSLFDKASSLKSEVRFHTGIADADLAELYRASDVFCLPGVPHPRRAEGFGLAYLEAAASGLTSLATYTDAIPEIVIHGQTGLLSTPGSVRELAENLDYLKADPGRRAQLGCQARKRAVDFTWARCAVLSYGEQMESV